MTSNTVFMLNEYRARQAKAQRNFAAAIEHSMAAADAATRVNDSRGFCRMTFNTAELQLELGRIEGCIATCRNLLATEAIKDYPDYESRARVLITHALQDKGETGGALAAAREAADLAQQRLPSETRFNIQHVLIAALAEEGDTETAWAEALILADMLSADATPRVKGMTHWAIGNVGFMSGRIEEGLKHHRLAADSLGLANDVRTWALFNKASVNMRLVAGLVDAETKDCLERAEVASDVAGVTEMDRIEIVITRAWWELESGNAAAAEGLLWSVEKRAATSYPVLQGRTLLLLARCLCTLERKAEALQCALQSERIFAEVGAAVLASESRTIIDTIELIVP
ncbi:hypothetical protein [Arthrobacter zhaoxinii]|uniref:hypothetical protein n=1 Tax=Arthrobacter zhaoxinii TaxID=2964616 RepID=UPI002103D58A|nr:hypothetical protein [Arthrobacter zhaoxinii]MCQ2001800.1 hypothetical protein [Arthrobacter zhaoxinii]